jgi:hypothetical protein
VLANFYNCVRRNSQEEPLKKVSQNSHSINHQYS